MIVSVHLADLPRRDALRLVFGGHPLGRVEGLLYCELTLAAPLSGALLPRPTLRRVGLIAAWADDEALDSFLRSHPLAARLADGWRTRLRPTRIVGQWEPLREMAEEIRAMDTVRDRTLDAQRVAVLTLGSLKLSQTWRFLAASSKAERLALDRPSLIASTGLARPPRLVATFSLWRSVDAMRSYVDGAVSRAHSDAMRAHARDPFHREAAFIRLVPYGSEGSWDGWDPVGRS